MTDEELFKLYQFGIEWQSRALFSYTPITNPVTECAEFMRKKFAEEFDKEV